MSIVWATRGNTWGFRFLRDGGHRKILETYNRAFSNVSDDQEVFHQNVDSIAARIADPLNRKDRSGRTIPHEFVLMGEDMHGIKSIDDVKTMIWPCFSTEYQEIWNADM